MNSAQLYFIYERMLQPCYCYYPCYITYNVESELVFLKNRVCTKSHTIRGTVREGSYTQKYGNIDLPE